MGDKPKALRWFALLGITALCIGCGDSTEVVSPVPAAPAAPSAPSAPSAPAAPSAPSAPADPADLSDPSDLSDLSDPSDPSDLLSDPSDLSDPTDLSSDPTDLSSDLSDPTDLPSDLPEPAARLLLPTTAGPLIVDVEIVIGDQPLREAFDARIDAVMDEAAGSSQLSWDNLFDHIAGDQQQFGRAAAINPQQRRGLIRRYDRNRNRRPDHDEVVRFLFRNAGFAGPFRIAGSNQYREFNRSQSAIFTAADRNGDQLLTADELEQIEQSLLRLDQNADQRLDVDEVASAVGDDNAAWKNDSASRWGDVAMDVSGYVDWSMLTYSLDEMPQHGPFGRARNAIKMLDQNDDESIDRDEAKGLLNVQADIRLRASFPESAGGQVQLQTVSVCEALQPLVEQTAAPDRVSISNDSFRLTASIADLGAARQQFPAEAFATLDTDNDGGLSESEIPTAALREYSFQDLDQDGDEKLTLREINEGMSPKQPIWSIQVRARGAETPDAVFAWLDQNQDQFLSSREIAGAQQRLRARASSEGTVKPSDIPDSYLIRFGRGDPNQDEQLLALTPQPAVDRASDHESWPRWARAMDINRDGEISHHEFLGTSRQFEQLDTDGDNFIESAEIAM